MVRGSDLDLVVIMDDQAPEGLAQQLDDAIYQQKYRQLINPSSREEIDYTIKPLARLKEQVAFDTFKNMVPCKILDEAVLLYGSRALYEPRRRCWWSGVYRRSWRLWRSRPRGHARRPRSTFSIGTKTVSRARSSTCSTLRRSPRNSSSGDDRGVSLGANSSLHEYVSPIRRG